MPPVPAPSPAHSPAHSPAAAPETRPGREASPALDWLSAPPTHSQEMKAAGEIRLGPLRLAGGARMTPAAVIASGICTGIILLGVAAVIRAGRR